MKKKSSNLAWVEASKSFLNEDGEDSVQHGTDKLIESGLKET